MKFYKKMHSILDVAPKFIILIGAQNENNFFCVKKCQSKRSVCTKGKRYSVVHWTKIKNKKHSISMQNNWQHSKQSN